MAIFHLKKFRFYEHSFSDLSKFEFFMETSGLHGTLLKYLNILSSQIGNCKEQHKPYNSMLSRNSKFGVIKFFSCLWGHQVSWKIPKNVKNVPSENWTKSTQSNVLIKSTENLKYQSSVHKTEIRY